MKKLKVYLLILAIALITIAAGYILNIGFIKSVCQSVLNNAGKSTLSVSAAVCTFLFYGTKNYWLILTGCAIAAALIIQLLIIGGSAGVFVIGVKALTFLVIAYVMNLVKLIVNEI